MRSSRCSFKLKSLVPPQGAPLFWVTTANSQLFAMKSHWELLKWAMVLMMRRRQDQNFSVLLRTLLRRPTSHSPRNSWMCLSTAPPDPPVSPAHGCVDTAFWDYDQRCSLLGLRWSFWKVNIFNLSFVVRMETEGYFRTARTLPFCLCADINTSKGYRLLHSALLNVVE